MKLAKRVSDISQSLTLAITAKAKRMKREGIDVIGLGAGELDFDTPEDIKAAAVEALNKGYTKYTPVSGITELKEAICQKMMRDNNVKCYPDQVLVSAGAKHSLFNAIMSLCDEGDEVILPSPYWVSYYEQIKIAGAKPVVVKTSLEHEFKIDIPDLKRAITPKTKLILLNSPNNPTGSVYSFDEISQIVNIAISNDIFILSDEIYEKILYDDARFVSPANISDKWSEHVIIINGVSKAYSMTGFRIGYMVANRDIISAATKLQSHSTSNATTMSQYAALKALTDCDKDTKGWIYELTKRRDLLYSELSSIEGIKCFKPKGAFYMFPDVSYYFGKSIKGNTIKSAMDFATYLLDYEKVAVVPGEAFGENKCVRISYALSYKDIEEAIKRIKNFLSALE